MIDDTKLLVMLAKVHQHANKMEDAMLALTKARDLQARYVLHMAITPDMLSYKAVLM